MVAVTNYHKLNFLTTERHSFISLEARSLKAEQNQDVSKALTPFRVSGENPPLGFSSFWWLPSILCFTATSLQSSRPASSNLSLLHLHIIFSVCDISLCLHLIRTHVTALGLTWITQDNLPITSIKTSPAPFWAIMR